MNRNYSILSVAEFEKLTGAKAQAADIAIRPEVVEISNQPIELAERHTFRAKICGKVPLYTKCRTVLRRKRMWEKPL